LAREPGAFAELAATKSLSGPLRGRIIAGTLRLPAKVSVTGDLTIVARTIEFAGGPTRRAGLQWKLRQWRYERRAGSRLGLVAVNGPIGSPTGTVAADDMPTSPPAATRQRAGRHPSAATS
jgi:hypothetical protein